MTDIYIGQYKNGRKLNQFNIIRYTTVCLVLEYFCKATYINQSYHIVSADLYQVKTSRNLSIIAIIVALASIFLSIFLQII